MRTCGTARRLRTSVTLPRKEPQVLSLPAYSVVLVKQVLSLGTQFTGFTSTSVTPPRKEPQVLSLPALLVET